MVTTAFGPQGPNYATSRPTADPKASAGLDTFFKNCSAAGARDGTFATADFFNVQLANLRYLCRTANVGLDDADDTMIYQAVRNIALANTLVVPILTAARTYYVNGSTGNNTNTGRTADAAFATIQKAMDVTASVNLNGYSVTVLVADGTYAPFGCPPVNGSGAIYITGNPSNPANVQIVGTVGSAIVTSGSGYQINGFKVSCTGTNGQGDPGNGIYGAQAGGLALFNMEYGPVIHSHVMSAGGGTVWIGGTERISGGGVAHYTSQVGSTILLNPLGGPVLTISAAVTFTSAFVIASLVSIVLGTFTSITGFSNVTGTKFNASNNSIISVNGAGINFFPGTLAGVLYTGAQYS